MGSKLALLAAELIALGLLVQRDAVADTAKARELFKRGIEQYKAKDYDNAAATLAKSYEMDPKPDALFAQAQAERLGGHCREATVHYHQLLETTQDLPTIKAVQANLALCAKEPEPPPVVVAPKPEDSGRPVPPPPPQIITKTVVRDVPHSDTLATVLFAGGMLAVGGGVGLYIASNGALDDAKHARTLDDHDKFTDRAKKERTFSFIAGGAGLAMMSIAVIKWSAGGPSESRPSSDVAVTPTAGGGMVTFSTPW